MTKIIWREWFNESAVAAMTKMGTLPREEIEIDTRLLDGEEVAAEIAKDQTNHGSELFRDGTTEIVILEPEEFAGTYKVYVDYEPTFSAFREDLG